MKKLQVLVTVWNGLLLMCVFVFIPLKQGFMNNIFGWSLYLTIAVILIVWVIDGIDIVNEVDEISKKNLFHACYAFIISTVFLLLYFLS